MIRSKALRYSVILTLTTVAGSTGTLLASDPCKVSLVQQLTGATHAVQKRIPVRHKHTKETLAAWESWGKDYLAKHGHAFVPPKRRVTSRKPQGPGEQRAVFKFSCEAPPVPLTDVSLTGLLGPEDVPPEIPALPAYVAELLPPADFPPPPEFSVPPSGTDTSVPGVPYIPIILPGGGLPGGGGPPVGPPSGPPTGPPTGPPVGPPTGPPVGPPVGPPSGPPDSPPDTPPTTVTPEPQSYVLMGTGLGAIWILRRRVKYTAQPGA